jgi:presenilin 1
MGGTAVYAVLEMYGVCADWFSFLFIMYNFAIVGVVSVFWQKGMDHIWTNAYLVMVSVILSFELAQFNSVGEWFPWCIVGALAMYDLCAVLAPCGPLKLLLDAVQNNERSESALNGLLFEADVGQHQDAGEIARSQARTNMAVALVDSTTAIFTEVELIDLTLHTNTAAGVSPATADARPAEHPLPQRVRGPPPRRPLTSLRPLRSPPQLVARSQPPSRGYPRGPPPPRLPQHDVTEENESPRGVKLGLGDFIFYSVLVSTAARHDFITFASCTLVVLLGLGLTLLLLVVAGKALPALPISILLGVFFYFVGRYTLEPYIDQMTLNAITI